MFTVNLNLFSYVCHPAHENHMKVLQFYANEEDSLHVVACHEMKIKKLFSKK